MSNFRKIKGKKRDGKNAVKLLKFNIATIDRDTVIHQFHIHHMSLRAESKSVDVSKNMLLLGYKRMIRSMFGPTQYPFVLSNYTGVTTSAAGVLLFNDISGLPQYITTTMSTNIAAEWASIALLFDDFKVCGMSAIYTPYNPYNRGTTVASDVIGLGFDDNANISSTTTNTGFSQNCERGRYFVTFTPDLKRTVSFMRPVPIQYYDWSPTLSPGVNTSSQGSLFVASVGLLSVSTRYGSLRYNHHLLLAMRY